jgi:AcrR family transcriptional regulator
MPAIAKSRRGPGRPRDDQLSHRRRREILSVAIRHFARHGFSASDVQSIADELRVGKGTVYRYFPSKDRLFLAAVDHGMAGLREAVDTAAARAESPLARIEAGIRAYLEYFDRHPDVVELIIQERAQFRDRKRPTYFVHRDANLGPWRDLFRRLIADGVLRDVPVDRILEVVSDFVYGTMFTNHFAGRKMPLATQARDVLDVLFHGLLANRKRGRDA